MRVLLVALKVVIARGWARGVVPSAHRGVGLIPGPGQDGVGIVRGPSIKHSLHLSGITCAASGLETENQAEKGRPLRISRLLANRGVGSRSEVEVMIRRGRIKVGDKVIKSPKAKFDENCVIKVDDEEWGPVPLLIAFHKPKGVICSTSDDWNREDLSSVLPPNLLRSITWLATKITWLAIKITYLAAKITWLATKIT
ncbi:unnamed protein product [Choristocarpus tenellus]